MGEARPAFACLACVPAATWIAVSGGYGGQAAYGRTDARTHGRLTLIATTGILPRMAEPFSTHVLDRALARKRATRETRRRERLEEVFRALEALSGEVGFLEAYVFGSLAKPHRFFAESDVDVAFEGLEDEDFLRAMAFLSRNLCTDVDVIQLEDHPLREKILAEGIRWTMRG